MANVIRCRLTTIPIEPVIDSIGLARHRVNHAIRGNVGAGIKIGRPVIVQIDLVDRVHVPMMVVNVHIGIGSE